MTNEALLRGAEPGGLDEATFPVMGTDGHVLVVGGPGGLAERARRRLDELEQKWSRFRPDSELCRLNAAGGAPVVVSPETFALVEHACAAWAATAGRFDPTVLPALETAGYDRDFATVAPDGPATKGRAASTPGCRGIDLDPVVGAVRLPRAVRLDLGGIGKGFAADLVAAELQAAGAAGVCVNLGGDLRVDGRPPSGTAWMVDVEMPGERPNRTGRARPLLSLASGAIATTSRVGRAWRRGNELLHHVIDPRTGLPAVTPWTSVTVVAGRGVEAEPLAKAALLAPSLEAAADVLDARSATGLLVDERGCVHPLAGLEEFLVEESEAPLMAGHLSEGS